MDRLKFIVEREFKDMIEQNSWLDSFWDYLDKAVEYLSDGYEAKANYYAVKAKMALDFWLRNYRYLPEKTKHDIAESLLHIMDTIKDIIDSDIYSLNVDELMRACYELIELAKIVSIIAQWEKIRDKIDRQLLNANAF